MCGLSEGRVGGDEVWVLWLVRRAVIDGNIGGGEIFLGLSKHARL
ncbi:hypothetical protein MCO_00605 [Bartonella sp. DB5-6]|nr:hypothetical protein [Bartonella sp. DB5-6]EJF78620.1 hypothetical protein MCO_00605 [Bartonella sp. DB5-6]